MLVFGGVDLLNFFFPMQVEKGAIELVDAQENKSATEEAAADSHNNKVQPLSEKMQQLVDNEVQVNRKLSKAVSKFEISCVSTYFWLLCSLSFPLHISFPSPLLSFPLSKLSLSFHPPSIALFVSPRIWQAEACRVGEEVEEHGRTR